jgi:hypothetical protein
MVGIEDSLEVVGTDLIEGIFAPDWVIEQEPPLYAGGHYRCHERRNMRAQRWLHRVQSTGSQVCES